jgi:hypothetical protein
LLLSELLKRGSGLLLAVVLMLLAECAAMVHLFARPHITSWLFTPLWFVALERWGEGRDAWWLPWFFPASIPDADAEVLRARGVAQVFTPKDFALTEILDQIVELLRARGARVSYR